MPMPIKLCVPTGHPRGRPPASGTKRGSCRVLSFLKSINSLNLDLQPPISCPLVTLRFDANLSALRVLNASQEELEKLECAGVYTKFLDNGLYSNLCWWRASLIALRGAFVSDMILTWARLCWTVILDVGGR